MTGHTHKLNKQQVHDLLEEGKLCLTGMNQRVPDLRRAEECFRLVMKDCGDVDARAEYYLVQPIWSWRTIAMGWTNPDVPVEDTIATQAISALFTRLGELVNFDQTDMDAVQQLFLIVVLYSSVLDPEPRAPNDSTDMIQQFLCRARLGRFRDATRALTTAVDRWAWKKKLETMKTPATTHKKRRQQRQRRVRTVMEIEEVVDLLSMWVGIHISAMHTLRFAMKEKHGLWEDKCEYWGWTLPWLECNDAIPDLINWASAHLAKFADVRSCQSHSLSVLSLQVLDDVRRESERGNRLIWRIAVEWRIRMRYCDHAANPDGPETQNLPNIPNQNFLSSNQSTTNTIAQLLREGDQGKNLCFLKRWWDATCTLSGDHYTWSDQQLAVKALLDQTDLPLYDEVIADDGDGHVWTALAVAVVADFWVCQDMEEESTDDERISAVQTFEDDDIGMISKFMLRHPRVYNDRVLLQKTHEKLARDSPNILPYYLIAVKERDQEAAMEFVKGFTNNNKTQQHSEHHDTPLLLNDDILRKIVGHMVESVNDGGGHHHHHHHK